jgi:hypothetical protein
MSARRNAIGARVVGPGDGCEGDDTHDRYCTFGIAASALLDPAADAGQDSLDFWIGTGAARGGSANSAR